MKEKLTELLNTLYEAEGLVEMALRRKGDTPDRITRLAIEKCYLVGHLAEEFPLPEEKENVAVSDNDNLPLYGNADVEAAAPRETAETEEPEKTEEPCIEDIVEEKEVEVFTEEILPEINSHIAVKQDIYDASIFDEDEEPSDFDSEVESDSVEEAAPEEVFQEEKAVAVFATARTDESRKPIMGFFSINDKFRFRRELFGGDDARFREALNVLQEAENEEIARQYCFENLQWNSESPEVKEFLQILEKYYRQ